MKKFKLTNILFKFEIRDLWIGLYWNYVPRLEGDYQVMNSSANWNQWDYDNMLIYICIVPMFPIVFSLRELPKAE